MQEIVAYDSQGNSLTNLVQWDNDVYIYLKGDEITSAHRVHFFNNTLNEALVVNSTYSDGMLKVKIPNSLLSQPHIIVGYVNVVKDGESKSLYCFKINVRKKPIPSNYIYVDTKDWIDAETVLQECSNYANTALQSATNAKESEANAEASEANAKESELNAKTSETNTKTSEANAEASERAAAQSAQNARTSEVNAKSYEDNALTNANNASQSATDAEGFAQKASAAERNVADSALEAKNYAAAAKESEIDAANCKDMAITSATNAKESEINASNFASSCSMSETNAITSASEAEASAISANTSAIAAQKAKQDILDMTVSAETLSPEKEATAEFTTDESGNISVKYGIPKGYDGHTPQRGIDYYTDSDVENIVNTVVGRIDTDGSGTQHVHANKDLLDSITNKNKEKWDTDARPVGIIEMTIPVTNWNNKMQVVENPGIDASDSYIYLVSPQLDCEIAYNDAFVRAKDIDTNSEIVFTCQKTPTVNLSVRVLCFDAINS